MKKVISVILCAAMVLSLFCAAGVSAGAEETTNDMIVPKVVVTTDDGNGNLLEKEDGYVGASVSITDTDGSVLEDAAKIKVRGNSTALAEKKPFTFKFDKKKDVLGMGKNKKWVLLANCFDPTLMRNYIAFDIARELDIAYTSEQRYVELWMDGVFKGCYTLMEPVDVGETLVDIDVKSNDGLNDFMVEFEAVREEEDKTYFTSNGFRFAASEPEEPTEEQIAYMQEKLDEFTGAIVSKDFNRMCEVLDMESFAKFYLLNEFVKNVDAVFSSLYYYYKDGKFYAGPPWDYDLSQGNPDPTAVGTYERASNPRTLYVANCNIFHYFMISNQFREYLRPIYTAHYTYFQNLYTEGGLMDQLLERYGTVFARNFNEAGWDVGKKYAKQMRQPWPTYEENVSFLREWLQTRNACLGNTLCAYHVNVAKVAQTEEDPHTLDIVTEWMKTDTEQRDYYVEVEVTAPMYCKKTLPLSEADKVLNYTTKRQAHFQCTLPVWANPDTVNVRIVMPGYMETLEPIDTEVTMPVIEDGTAVTMGDVNRDDAVTIDDATELQRICASVTVADETQQLLGDINADGVIDITEATRVQRYLAEQPADEYTKNIGKSFKIA